MYFTNFHIKLLCQTLKLFQKRESNIKKNGIYNKIKKKVEKEERITIHKPDLDTCT